MRGHRIFIMVIGFDPSRYTSYYTVQWALIYLVILKLYEINSDLQNLMKSLPEG
uniref:Uncharacterized protein n=1 Tax=Oryza sativa subsp. japonica TaxID=39947 RepID=Q6YTW8_ORYSJ|nr:hypothetical protein [Oryza sativa Japonica Group]